MSTTAVIPVRPSDILSDWAKMSNEQLAAYVKRGFRVFVKDMAPYLVELRRRFKNLKDGEDIDGHTKWENYCQSVLEYSPRQISRVMGDDNPASKPRKSPPTLATPTSVANTLTDHFESAQSKERNFDLRAPYERDEQESIFATQTNNRVTTTEIRRSQYMNPEYKGEQLYDVHFIGVTEKTVYELLERTNITENGENNASARN